MHPVPRLGSRDFFVPRQLYRDHVKNLARDVTLNHLPLENKNLQ